MQQIEKSMEMQTTRPTTELEQTNFNRLGGMMSTLLGVSITVIIFWAAMELFSLNNMVYSRFSLFTSAKWIVIVSMLLSLITLYKTHELLLSSSKQWLYDFWTLRLRPDLAAAMNLKAIGFPFIPTIIIVLATYLSIIGSFQLVESYGYKATTRSYDTATVADMIATNENNQRNALFSNEKRLNAEKRNAIESLQVEINKLEHEREKWVKMKVSSSVATTKAKEELHWLNAQIRDKEKEIKQIKQLYNNKVEEENAKITARYTAKADTLLSQQQKGIEKIEAENNADKLKEQSTLKEGRFTGIIASLIFLLTFIFCQVYRIKYAVECGIYEQHTYSFIDSLGGVRAIYTKILLALAKERLTKLGTSFYNKYTISELSELNTTFTVNRTENVATNNTSSVATTTYISKEEVEARFKVLQRQIGNYVGFLERGERLTANTFNRAKQYLDNLLMFIEQCDDENLKSDMQNYYNLKSCIVEQKEKEVTNG